jgi:hypothetical protein
MTEQSHKAITPGNEPGSGGSAPTQSKIDRRRKLLLAGASTVIVAAALAIGVPWVRDALNTVSTDDAYVNSHVTFVGPRVRGQVARVLVDDNNRVRPGDVLFLIQSQSQARHQSSYICIVPSEADRAASGGSRSSSQVKACDGACRPLSSAFRARSTACPAARCARITASAARPLQAILDKNPTSFGQSDKVFRQPINHPRHHQRA